MTGAEKRFNKANSVDPVDYIYEGYLKNREYDLQRSDQFKYEQPVSELDQFVKDNPDLIRSLKTQLNEIYNLIVRQYQGEMTEDAKLQIIQAQKDAIGEALGFRLNLSQQITQSASTNEVSRTSLSSLQKGVQDALKAIQEKVTEVGQSFGRGA